jgi:hypothetical protein
MSLRAVENPEMAAFARRNSCPILGEGPLPSGTKKQNNPVVGLDSGALGWAFRKNPYSL